MFKNYFTIAFRHLRRQKLYSVINILGLAVGIACFLIILIFIQHELSYDRFHTNADRIYRVVQQQPGSIYLGTDRFAVTPAPLASTLVQEFPEVKHATSVDDGSALLSLDDRHFYEEGIWADGLLVSGLAFRF